MQIFPKNILISLFDSFLFVYFADINSPQLIRFCIKATVSCPFFASKSCIFFHSALVSHEGEMLK